MPVLDSWNGPMPQTPLANEKKKKTKNKRETEGGNCGKDAEDGIKVKSSNANVTFHMQGQVVGA